MTDAPSFDAQAALNAAGLRDVIAERVDQIDRHGFTLAHDMGHHPANLALGAASYLNTAIDQLHGRHYDPRQPADTWPWEREAWRPGDARANIVKALAIGLAVLDRIDNAARDAGDDLPGLFDGVTPARAPVPLDPFLLPGLRELDSDDAQLSGTPMIPIHRTTLQRIIVQLAGRK